MKRLLILAGILGLASAAIGDEEKLKKLSFKAAPEVWDVRTEDFQFTEFRQPIIEFDSKDRKVRGALLQAPFGEGADDRAEAWFESLAASKKRQFARRLRDAHMGGSAGGRRFLAVAYKQDEESLVEVRHFSKGDSAAFDMAFLLKHSDWDASRPAIETLVDSFVLDGKRADHLLLDRPVAKERLLYRHICRDGEEYSAEEFWTCRPDGTDRKRIAARKTVEHSRPQLADLNLSPNGLFAVGHSFSPDLDNWTLLRLDVAKGEVLPFVPEIRPASTPVYSPDGQMILFFVSTGQVSRRVWLMNSDGSNPRARTPLADDDVHDSAGIWIPDSSGIFVTRLSSASNELVYEVIRVDPEGKNPRRIASLDTTAQPVLSPDSKRIAFSPAGGESGSLDVASLDGTDVKTALTLEDVRSTRPLAWSQFEDRVLLSTWVDGEHQRVDSVASDGTGFRTLLDHNWRFDELALSPDGRFLAFFCRDGKNSMARLCVLSLETGNVELVVDEEVWGVCWVRE
ncbi:MAG: hypothetical protein AAB074_16105 [Planctomycetota bacterium]